MLTGKSVVKARRQALAAALKSYEPPKATKAAGAAEPSKGSKTAVNPTSHLSNESKVAAATIAEKGKKAPAAPRPPHPLRGTVELCLPDCDVTLDSTVAKVMSKKRRGIAVEMAKPDNRPLLYVGNNIKQLSVFDIYSIDSVHDKFKESGRATFVIQKAQTMVLLSTPNTRALSSFLVLVKALIDRRGSTRVGNEIGLQFHSPPSCWHKGTYLKAPEACVAPKDKPTATASSSAAKAGPSSSDADAGKENESTRAYPGTSNSTAATPAVQPAAVPIPQAASRNQVTLDRFFDQNADNSRGDQNERYDEPFVYDKKEAEEAARPLHIGELPIELIQYIFYLIGKDNISELFRSVGGVCKYWRIMLRSRQLAPYFEQLDLRRCRFSDPRQAGRILLQFNMVPSMALSTSTYGNVLPKILPFMQKFEKLTSLTIAPAKRGPCVPNGFGMFLEAIGKVEKLRTIDFSGMRFESEELCRLLGRVVQNVDTAILSRTILSHPQKVLENASKLKTLHVDYSRTISYDVYNLESCSNITSLSAIMCDWVPAEAIISMVNSGRVLKRLNAVVACLPHETQESMATAMAAMEELDLTVEAGDVPHLLSPGLSPFTSLAWPLRTLRLRLPSLPPAEHISSLFGKLNQLRELSFLVTNSETPMPQEAYSMISTMRHLETLEITGICDEAFAMIMNECSSLQSLTIQSSSLVLPRAIPVQTTSLHTLIFNKCKKLLSPGLTSIIENNPGIRRLGLEYVSLGTTDALLAILAEKSPKLIYLNIRDCEMVSTSALYRLLQHSRDSLRELFARGTTVSEIFLQELNKTHSQIATLETHEQFVRSNTL